ncbi:DUF5134 domain-containing protein [Saccharopolyspora erythraea]|uniref:DUF5134 domain-containing protein n=1 Tax=Saccharopolyspora erythraea TaxID=1836 RepID=UPI001BACF7BD|nr:DUF5134 domain-containing protein [Saccharopolyspora erythraea]QUH02688.1 DUF5134 domain-containing protein [Saccharopolyspora erythraea]
MVEALLLRWILTILFTGTALWSLRRLLAPACGVADRISSAAHLLMSALMVAMAWPWGMAIPAAPQIVLFGLAALWFAFLAGNRRRTGDHHGHGSPVLAHVHHALMMAAMVWMVATMPLLMTGHSPDSGHGGHHHSLGASAAGIAAAGPVPAGPPGPVVAVSVLLGAAFVVTALPWTARALDIGRGALRPTGGAAPRIVAAESTCHAAMSFGMGVMLLTAL